MPNIFCSKKPAPDYKGPILQIKNANKCQQAMFDLTILWCFHCALKFRAHLFKKYPVHYETFSSEPNRIILCHKRKEDLSLQPLIKIRFGACGKRVVLAFGAGVKTTMINSANDNESNKISQDYFYWGRDTFEHWDSRAIAQENQNHMPPYHKNV